MFACPTCDFKNHDGALFCEACGTYFHTGGTLATNLVQAEPHARHSPAGSSKSSAESEGARDTLLLTSDADQRQFVIDARTESVLLGRSDRKSRLFVDIDLTGADGQAFGVSRRHARAHYNNGRFMLEDLESLNGTFLNGRKLRPYLPEVLHDGDEVTLGSLVLRVSFKEQRLPPVES